MIGYQYLGSNSGGAKHTGAPNPSADAKQGEKKIDQTDKAITNKTFTGGDQGFVDLKLGEIIPYNHNTKIFKFELPDPDQVSGLNVACESA